MGDGSICIRNFICKVRLEGLLASYICVIFLKEDPPIYLAYEEGLWESCL